MNRKFVNFRIARSRSGAKFDNIKRSRNKISSKFFDDSDLLVSFSRGTGRLTGLLMIVITIVNIETFRPISLVGWSLKG